IPLRRVHPFREARWRYQSKRAATPHHGTSSGSDDVRSYNSDSIAAACATARQCSKSKEQLPTHGAPEPVSGQAVHQQCALPESVSGCAPTARPSAESSALYSRSTLHRNFEIGSSHSSRIAVDLSIQISFRVDVIAIGARNVT